MLWRRLPAIPQGFKSPDVEPKSNVKLDDSGQTPLYDLVEREAKDHEVQHVSHGSYSGEDHGCEEDRDGQSSGHYKEPPPRLQLLPPIFRTL